MYTTYRDHVRMHCMSLPKGSLGMTMLPLFVRINKQSRQRPWLGKDDVRRWILILAVSLFVVAGLRFVQAESGFAAGTTSAVCTTAGTDEVRERTASWDATVWLQSSAMARQAPDAAAVHDLVPWELDGCLTALLLVCASGLIPRSPPFAALA